MLITYFILSNNSVVGVFGFFCCLDLNANTFTEPGIKELVDSSKIVSVRLLVVIVYGIAKCACVKILESVTVNA